MTTQLNRSNIWRTAIYGSVALLFVVALLVTLDRGSMVSAAQTDLTSVYVNQDLPINDASSTMWDLAIESEVPLSGQNIAPPFNVDATVDTIRIRSIHNGSWVAFRMEWDDNTMNEGGGSDDYRDSVALQFPINGGEPFVCMGFADAEVNILHWRADFQRVIEDGPLSINDIFANAKVNIYNQADDLAFTPAVAVGNPIAVGDKPSAVEDLIATGFGTLEAQEVVHTTGWGDWDGSKWSVVIARPLQTHDVQDTQFELGSETPVALAVWNGEEKDVNGKKSVSTWVNVAVQDVPGTGSSGGGGTFDAPDPIVLGSPSQTTVVETSNAALWALTGGLAVIVGLLIFVPAVIFIADRRKRA
jgi:DMSO reductase family type II enzyme heme b subunit